MFLGIKAIRINRELIAFVIFILWIATFMHGMMFHEIWRDEMRALSIAIESPDIFHLHQSLRNEGHPILWYLCLKIAYSIFHSTLVLPVLSYAFSAGIAFYMLFKSPFPLLFSTLLIFGFWGMYEYGIVSRNYGIAAFFMLCFADAYSKNKQSIFLPCVYLFLAIQCNYFASILGVLLTFYVFLMLLKEKQLNIKKSCILALPLLSFVLSSLTCMPDSNSLVSTGVNYFSDRVYKVYNVGLGFDQLIFYWFNYSSGFLSIVLGLGTFLFFKNIRAAFVYISSLLFMSYFSIQIYQAQLHHIGMWVYFTLVLIWINYKTIRSALMEKSVTRYVTGIGALAFVFIIANNFHRGRYMLKDDIRALKSDSKEAAFEIKKLGKDVLVISEPDYIMESVMYYTYKPFYIARERTINSYVHFTSANASTLSLKELINRSDSFEKIGQKTALVFSYLITHKDSVFRYAYKKTFVMDSFALRDFHKKFQIQDSANGNWYTDERYYIYKRKDDINSSVLTQ